MIVTNKTPGKKRMSQSAIVIAASTSAKSDIETSTIRAISLRLIPFLVLAYFFSYLDRVNLGFAALPERDPGSIRRSSMTEVRGYGFRRAPERLGPFINAHEIMIYDEY
jgi:hypothetical protein